MKRLALTLICLVSFSVALFAAVKSQTVVYINGNKYYIHTLQSGESIASLAELYRVSERSIESNNPNFISLMIGENVKVPFVDSSSEGEQITGLKRLFSFNKHRVEAGETLYAISRKYAISIDIIIEDNPDIDPAHLSVGEVVLIRKNMKGKSDESQNQQEWSDYTSDLNLIAHQEDYTYHIVEKGETIYSLARKAGVSEEEFIELNNLSDGLKAGSIVKMQRLEGDESADEQSADDGQESMPVSFAALAPNQTLKVALMLPLSNSERVNRQFAEFYNGFLLGLERVKSEWGRKIELTLYNTERNLATVDSLVMSDNFAGTQLIVGPIYEDLLLPVLQYAEQNHIPVVTPLATLKETNSSVVFQMAPYAERRYEKLEELLLDTKHITLIYTQSNDPLFEAEVLAMLGERPYDTHTYVYEHPNDVAKKIKQNKVSPSDLTKIICNGKDNTVIVLADNETDVDRVLSALSSAQINFIARGGSMPKYRVIGDSGWSRYQNIDRTVLFKNSVTLISSYHANRSNVAVKLFDSKYIKNFGAVPSLYAYRGYDAAVIFGEGMYSDIEYNMEGRTFMPLQSHYLFERDTTSNIRQNSEWQRVDYNRDYTITIK